MNEALGGAIHRAKEPGYTWAKFKRLEIENKLICYCRQNKAINLQMGHHGNRLRPGLRRGSSPRAAMRPFLPLWGKPKVDVPDRHTKLFCETLQTKKPHRWRGDAKYGGPPEARDKGPPSTGRREGEGGRAGRKRVGGKRVNEGRSEMEGGGEG